MYEISYDPKRALIELTIGGFWTVDTARAFAVELEKAVSEARGNGPFCVLSDARGFSVQASNVVDRFTALAENSLADRAAIVVTSALARSQAKRSMQNDRIRVFASMDDARLWLATPND